MKSFDQISALTADNTRGKEDRPSGWNDRMNREEENKRKRYSRKW
jgi:hypothetical protein